MADESRDAGKSKTGAEKKQPETVLLTAEELRAIAGGAAGSLTSATPPTSSGPTPKDAKPLT